MRLIRDFTLVILSIFVAILLVRTHAIDSILYAAQNVKLLGIFVAGLFFTSAFTTPLSIAALGEMSLTTPIWQVALTGACGALVGDLIIFSFIRDTFAKDVSDFLKAHPQKKLRSLFKYRIFRWLTAFGGALVIASPLPDEVGLAMMGFSRMSIAILVPVSFVMNFVGILLIALVAHAL